MHSTASSQEDRGRGTGTITETTVIITAVLEETMGNSVRNSTALSAHVRLELSLIHIQMCIRDRGKAERELGWKAQYGIKEMCADSWRWQKNNPNGYED